MPWQAERGPFGPSTRFDGRCEDGTFRRENPAYCLYHYIYHEPSYRAGADISWSRPLRRTSGAPTSGARSGGRGNWAIEAGLGVEGQYWPKAAFAFRRPEPIGEAGTVLPVGPPRRLLTVRLPLGLRRDFLSGRVGGFVGAVPRLHRQGGGGFFPGGFRSGGGFFPDLGLELRLEGRGRMR